MIMSQAENQSNSEAMEYRPAAENGQTCEECGLIPFKYKCPGCGLRSCGLACVKAHKARTQCTGKRNRTQFVPLSQFDENWLISDYNLLEEILRMTEAAKRIRPPFGGRMKPLSVGMKALRREAKNRGTNLEFLPKGMSKRNTNKSRYDKRRKCIFWTVEWRFHSTNVIFVDNEVNECVSLRSVMEKHLTLGPGNPVLRHKLRHFCKEPPENLKCLLKKEHSEGTKELYFELKITEPLRFQLARKTIIEYPVVHVVLPASFREFEIFEDQVPAPDKDVNPPNDDDTEDLKLDAFVNMDRAPFREEEIEEGEFEIFEDQVSAPEKDVKSVNADDMEDVKLNDLVNLDRVPLREEEIEKGEFEIFEDQVPALEKDVKSLNADDMEDVKLDDLVNLGRAPSREEDIEEGEFEIFEEQVSAPEKDVESLNSDDMENIKFDLVNIDRVPFREEEIEEGELEIFEDQVPVREKDVESLNADDMEDLELDDLINLDRAPLREEEIEEGEFVPQEYFS